VKVLFQVSNQFSKRAFLISTFALAAALATGCGEIGGSNPAINKTGSSSSAITTSSTGTTTIDGFTCPTSPNVVPKQTTTSGAEDNYTVCTNNTPGQLFITGSTTSSDQICVIPVSSTNSIGTPNLSVQIQCPFTSGGNGITLSYSTISYNAVAIVEAANAVQMYNCLAYGGTCPNYSYGVLPNATSTSTSTTTTGSTGTTTAGG
jgi:hypothetical protein